MPGWSGAITVAEWMICEPLPPAPAWLTGTGGANGSGWSPGGTAVEGVVQVAG
jgi:hypothetical protein